MNTQRPYGQGMQRPNNQTGPAIRAGLSVQELKAMTAMRVGHDDPSKPGAGPQDYPSGGAYRNPASSYQTATPQQLQAAGITPVVINDRPMVRQKSSTLNSFPVYAPSSAYPDQDLVGQNRPYNYDDMRVPGHQSRTDAPYVNTSSYAKASSTAYHQNAMPNRGGAPQINSVEDVKEMTRLRMLMSERDAFFDSSGSGRNPSEPHSNRSGGSDYDAPFEDRLAAPRFPGHSAGPSVNTSTDSYDSYDFPSTAVDARSPPFRGISSTGAPLNAPSLQHQSSVPLLATHSQKGMYASAPVPQQSAYAPVAAQNYGVASGSGMLNSASVGGLGIRGTNVLSQPSQQASPLYASSTNSSSNASGSPTYQQQAAPRGLIGSTVRPPVHSTAVVGNGSLGLPTGSSGLSLTGSSVIGGRRAPAPISSGSLAPLPQHSGYQQYGSQPSSLYQQEASLNSRAELDASLAREPPRVDRGIERDLMLSAQLTGHSGLTGNMDRLDRSINGNHNSSLLSSHGIFDENILRGQDPNLRSQMLDHSNSMRGVGPSSLGSGLGGSSRGVLNGNNFSMNNNQRADLSLNSLLGESSTSTYQRAGAQVVSPIERTDNLFDLLSSEGIPMPRNGAHGTSSPYLSGLSPNHEPQRSPRELQPLPASSKALLGSLSGVNTPSPVRSPSPVQLAPLSPLSPLQIDVSPTKNKMINPATGVVPRKLSSVGKAATYNNAVTSTKSDIDSSTQSAKTGPSGQRIVAFGERSESLDGAGCLSGIASPSFDGNDSSDHVSPAAQSASGRFPLIKAHTTSRIPTESPVASALSPKLLRKKSTRTNAPGGLDCTPPSSALDRSDSSSNMNYLASEMAEMVLDYSGNFDLGLLSRDNSNDLTRILAAMSGSAELLESPSAGGLNFKRTLSNNSLGYTE